MEVCRPGRHTSTVAVLIGFQASGICGQCLTHAVVSKDGYWFPPDPVLSAARNAARDDRTRVPDLGLRATLRRLRRPCYADGFRPVVRRDLRRQRWLPGRRFSRGGYR